jgi:hypothetical protein
MAQAATANVQIHLFAQVTEIYDAVAQYIRARTPADVQLIIAHSNVPSALLAMAAGHRFDPQPDRRHNPARRQDIQGGGRYLFVPTGLVTADSANNAEILAYEPRAIQNLADLRPILYTLFLSEAQIDQASRNAPADLLAALTFKQRACFSAKYNPQAVAILQGTGKGLGSLPFPDTRHLARAEQAQWELVAAQIRDREQHPCDTCGAIRVGQMEKGFCCAPFGEAIKNHLPNAMTPWLRERVADLTNGKPNAARTLNRLLRPVIQNTDIHSPRGPGSTVFLNGIPYALDQFRQFHTPVYAVFINHEEHAAETSLEMREIIRYIIPRNPVLASHVSRRWERVQNVAISMAEPDQGMNLAILNADAPEENDDTISTIRKNYGVKPIPPTQMIYDQLIYPLLFSKGKGGAGVEEHASRQGATLLMRKTAISGMLQPQDNDLHLVFLLREEWGCSLCGRLINEKVKWLLNAEHRYFGREDEIRAGFGSGNDKEYGLRNFIPPSLTDSDEYWRRVRTKCFALTTRFGPPTFFLTFTMNPHWHDYQALKRDKGVFSDSAMIAIVFKAKMTALMKFILKRKILGGLNIKSEGCLIPRFSSGLTLTLKT